MTTPCTCSDWSITYLLYLPMGEWLQNLAHTQSHTCHFLIFYSRRPQSWQDFCLNTERKFTIKHNEKCFQSTLKDYLFSKMIVLKDKNLQRVICTCKGWADDSTHVISQLSVSKKLSSFDYDIEQMVNYSVRTIELYLHLGRLLSTLEAKVAFFDSRLLLCLATSRVQLVEPFTSVILLATLYMIDILGSFCLGKPVPFAEAPLCLNPAAENHLTLLCLTSYSWWDPMELNTWFCQEQVDFFPFWVFPRWPLKSRKSMLLKCTT